MPVMTCALAVLIEHRVPSSAEALSLMLLSLGVMVSVWEGHVTGSTTSIMLCISSTVCNAAMMCTTSTVLSEEVDVLRLTFYTAPASCALLLPIFIVQEVRHDSKL